MADRKILFRSGANVNEASPTADRARLIGLLSGAATLTLENSGGQTAVLGSSALTLSSGVNITGTGTAHVTGFTDATFAGDVAVNGGDLTTTATTMNVANANATTVNAFGAGTTISIGSASGTTTINNATATVTGNLNVNGGTVASTAGTVALFNTTTTTLNVGGAATAMSVGNSAGTVTFPGDLALNGGDLTTTATTFNLINATATTVNFAQASTTLDIGALTGTTKIRNNARITGNLIVDGTTTTVNSENVNTTDNHFLVNLGAPTTAETGGLVALNQASATSTAVVASGFVAGVAATSNPTVAVTSTAGFAAGDYIMITGAANATNNGLFEVNAVLTAPTRIQIRGVGTAATAEDFTQNQFVTDTTVAGTVTKLSRVSVIRAGTDGVWETATGSTTPITFSDLSTSAASGWTDDGVVVRLTTSTDNVTLGSATAGGKLFVDGDTDEIQEQIQANTTQTANLTEWQDSAGTMIASINSSGNLIFGNTDHTIGYSSASARILTFDNTGAGTLASIRPGTHNETDLGVTGTRWKDGWFQGNISAAGTITAGATITIDGTANSITGSAATSIVTSAGALTLTPTTQVTLSSGKAFVSAGGAANLDFSASSGTLSGPTGTTTLNGATSVSGSNTFTVGTGTATFGGSISQSAGTAGLQATTVTGTFTQTGDATSSFGSDQTNFNSDATAGVTETGRLRLSGAGATTLRHGFLRTSAASFGFYEEDGAGAVNGSFTFGDDTVTAASYVNTFRMFGRNSSASKSIALDVGSSSTNMALSASGLTTFEFTSLNISQTGSTTFTTGTGAVTLNGATTISGTNTFATGTGAVTINGNTTLPGTQTFTMTTGTLTTGGNISQTGATTFSTGTGTNTLNGNTSISGSNTFSTGTGAVTIQGAATVSANFKINDNTFLNLGTDTDWQLTYDETTDDALELTGTASAATVAGTKFTTAGSAGGAASGATAGGLGGLISLTPGAGGAAAGGAGAAGAGGALNFTAGGGGNGTATGAAGAGATSLLSGGNAGSDGGAGGAAAGSVTLRIGSRSGSGTRGQVGITSVTSGDSVLNFTDGVNADTAAASEGRIRFNATLQKLQFSENTGAYASFASAAEAGGWSDDGAVVRLTSSTDNVGIGTPTPGANKVNITNDTTTDKNLNLTMVASQTADPFNIETSAASSVFSVSTAGAVTAASNGAFNGGSLTTTASTGNVFNANATTVNAFGAGTTINMGAAGSTFATGFGSITSTQTTVNLLNATVTTLNLGGAATTINAGAAGSTLATGFTALTTSQASVSVFNATATTGNLFGAATTINIGASGGTTTFPGSVAINGNVDLGNATADTVNITGLIGTANVQFTDAAHTLTITNGASPGDTLSIVGQQVNSGVLRAGNLQLTGGAAVAPGTGGGGSVLINGGAPAMVGALNGGVEINAGTGGIPAAILIGNTTATITSIQFGNSTDNPVYTFAGSGAVRPTTDTVAGSSLGASAFGWGAFWMRNVADDETVNLRASTANSSGAEAVGFDPTGLTVVTALNVQDAIEQLDASATNAGSVTFTAGAGGITANTVVRISANNTVLHAIATSEAAATAVGFSEAAITAAATGTISTGDGGLVEAAKFVAGLTLAANDTCFISPVTAGRLTNVAPTTSGQVVAPVAVVKDASTYTGAADDPAAVIIRIKSTTLIA